MGNFRVSSVARVFQLRCIQYTALHRWKNAETLSKNAKMMFDEAQVFKGLLAWFSASVPTRLRSQWVTNGGIQSNDFDDADYIFSSNATAKDILRIFDSETYRKEELTIFRCSLIEDTLTNGKSYLSGKYLGAYILIHPAFQKEIENFHKEQCLQSNVKLTKKEDGLESYPNTCSSYKFESFITQQQIMEEEPSDEWDFVDDSNLHKKDLNDARKRCEAIVQSDRNSEMLHDSSLMNLNPTALNQLWLEPPPNREQELTLKFARKGTSNCFLGESQEKGLCGKYSQNLMDLEREQDLYCGEYQRKSDFEGVKERESLVSDSQLKNKATLETPRSCSMSKFLSSMDDGFVHIDDIKLPDSPIYDFLPNQNGCQVEPK